MHPRNPGWKSGDYWMECDICGFDYRRSQMRERWDGLWTCKKDWEPRHELDFLRSIADDVSVPVSRPSDGAGGIEKVSDADTTLTVGTDQGVQLYEDALTANRTITLDTTGAINGNQFIVYRTNANSFTLDVGGLYTAPANIDYKITVKYNGNAWVLEQAIPLEL